MGGLNVTIFVIVAAITIAVTRILLSFMEMRDESKGFVTNPKEYKITGILKIIFQEEKEKISRSIQNRKKKRMEKRNGTESVSGSRTE